MKVELAGAILLIRVDASVRMGWGHVMRCLALAQAWQTAGGGVCFCLVAPPPLLLTRLTDEGMAYELLTAVAGSEADAVATRQIAVRLGAVWIVVDGYQFDGQYQKRLKEIAAQLLVLDDYGHATDYVADLILNQNLYAKADLYAGRTAANTALCLGAPYILLRREFWRWRTQRGTLRAKGRHLLVTLGGSDPDNVTAVVLKGLLALAAPDTLEVTVVVGGGNPHVATLEALLAPHPQWQVKQNVTDMSLLMAQADLVISASGSTSWELAFMGVPALLVVLADNQQPVVDYLLAKGTVGSLGSGATLSAAMVTTKVAALLADEAERRRQHTKGMALLDGWGGARLVAQMNGIQLLVKEGDHASFNN